MIDIKLLEKKSENGSFPFFEEYKKSLSNRGLSPEVLEQILELNKKRKELITLAETSKANQNKVSGEIARMKREGEDAGQKISEMSILATKVKELEHQAASVDLEVHNLLLTLPNLPRPEVPVGKTSADNQEVHRWGEAKKFSFIPKEHSDLGEELGVIDFGRAAKTTGSRFAFLRRDAARLERALIQFMMDLHSKKHGCEEIIPPYIVNSQSLVGTGQLPNLAEDMFRLDGLDYYLIPTAEVPVTNFYHGEVLSESQLPHRFVAFSPCFRSEAGSHGKDTKGLIRQHQFHKVELMFFCRPEESESLHEELTQAAETVLKELELPFRRMLLCTGDMSFGSCKTYDLEVWLPGQKAYREISSCSNYSDFQARRSNMRYKPANGSKPAYLHTINGSGLAVGRTLIAIFENYQQEDGTIEIPRALRSYMGGQDQIKKTFETSLRIS